MMSAAKKRASTANQFPALAQFLSGYLHEDFVLDYKTADGARDAFLKDASVRERAAVVKELEQFMAASEAASWADARTSFSAIGGAWMPKSRVALSDFARGFQNSPRRRSK